MKTTDKLYALYIVIPGDEPIPVPSDTDYSRSDIEEFFESDMSPTYITLRNGSIRSFSEADKKVAYWLAKPKLARS